MTGQPASSFGMPTAVPTGPPTAATVLAEALTDIKKKYAPYLDGVGNPVPTQGVQCRPNLDCKFSTVIYKKYDGNVNPYQQLLDVPKSDEIDRNNPDPEFYYAMKDLGALQLQQRYNHQQTTQQQHLAHIKSLQEIVEAVDKNNSQLQMKYEALRNADLQLKLALLAIFRKIEVLRNHGKPIQGSEVK